MGHHDAVGSHGCSNYSRVLESGFTAVGSYHHFPDAHYRHQFVRGEGLWRSRIHLLNIEGHGGYWVHVSTSISVSLFLLIRPVFWVLLSTVAELKIADT